MAQKTCFIKQDGNYVEMPYVTFLELCEISEEYSTKWLIPLHGYLMEVEESDYKDFYKTIRRGKYREEQAILHGEVSYNALDTDEQLGEELLQDLSVDVSEQVVYSIMVEKLHKALLQLSSQELELINALYFRWKSQREMAEIHHISQPAIKKRQDKILAKLRKFLET